MNDVCDSCTAVAQWHDVGQTQFFCLDHGYPGTPSGAWVSIRAAVQS